MDITVSRKELVRLVARMQGVAERKSTIPTLSCVLFVADEGGSVRLAATDTYLSLLGSLPSEIAKPGSVAVSAKDLFERIKMMPEGPIQISVGTGHQTTLKAKTGARRYTLRGMPGEDFPALPQPQENSPSLSMPVAVLRELIERTHFSISTDETRAHLNSALFEWDGDVVKMVTTDGHRLTKYEATLEGTKETVAMLIPQKAVSELRALCDEILQDGSTEPMKITQSGSNAFFQHGTTTFSVKIVDAQFPSYGQVIPQASDKNVKAPRAELANSLRAVSIAASERTGGVRVAVSKGMMRITSESPDSGDGFDEIAVDYKGPDITIGFNARYFLDVLAALSEEEVTLSLNGELDPAVLRPSPMPKGRDFLAVVMPMRI